MVTLQKTLDGQPGHSVCHNCKHGVYRIVFLMTKAGYSKKENREVMQYYREQFIKYPHIPEKWNFMSHIECKFHCNICATNQINECKEFKEGKPEKIVVFEQLENYIHEHNPKRCTICAYCLPDVEEGGSSKWCQIVRKPLEHKMYCDCFVFRSNPLNISDNFKV